jgi:hypothetical protein
MEKEFVPYEQALALKELEFDGPCFGVYIAGHLMITYDSIYNSTDIPVVKAPTFSQAFRWFREKGYLSYIEVFNDGKYDYTNVSSYFSEEVDYNDGPFDTYEEAELACLKKLIEIVEIKE